MARRARKPDAMAEQLQFPFPSLDFPGRTMLTLDEVRGKLGLSKQHVIDLIVEGKLQAIDVRSTGARRALYRIPVECYRDFVVRMLTTPAERLRLLRELPKATLRELVREITTHLSAA